MRLVPAMQPMTLSEVKSRAKDRFSSILIFCPNWPALARTSMTENFEELITWIEDITSRTRSGDTKHWLRICLQEIQESWRQYQAGDLQAGRKTIQVAESHFDDAFAHRSMAPRFMAGASGATLDNDEGFPA
jgi:hypothetical protein